MNQSEFLQQLKAMEPEDLLFAIAEAHTGKDVDIYSIMPAVTVQDAAEALNNFIEELKGVD